MQDLTAEEVIAQNDLNDKVKDLPIISELKEGQKKIIYIIEEEKVLNKKAFDSGAEKFDDLYEKVEEMGTQIREGFNGIESAIKSKENEELRHELRGLRREKDTESDRNFTYKSGIILIVATVVLTAIFTNLPNISFKSEKPKVKYIINQ